MYYFNINHPNIKNIRTKLIFSTSGFNDLFMAYGKTNYFVT